MKLRLIIFWMAVLGVTFAYSQQLKVEGMSEIATDLSAATSPRLDLNSNACALLKVQIPMQGVIFEGNVIGDAAYKGGEYWVYMTEGSKKVMIKHESCAPLLVSFADYGIKSLKSKNVYVLKMLPPEQVTGEVTFKVTPPDAILTIDNREYELHDGVATVRLPAATYSYMVVAPGYKVQSNVFAVVKDGSGKIVVELDPKEGASAVKLHFKKAVAEMEADEVPFSLVSMEEHDAAEAAKLYRKSADQGNDAAQYNLGLMYDSGSGVSYNSAEAAKWYLKSAEQGNMYAQSALGFKYYYGDGVNKDLSEAVEWYRKAAEQGHANAQRNLGCMYEFGIEVKQDYKEAANWYLKAAAQGQDTAQNSLGCMYRNGEGVRRDDAEAVKWFLEAAGQGYRAAQFNLALSYEYGIGVAKDIKEAKKWYKFAADQGDEEAQKALVRLGGGK